MQKHKVKFTNLHNGKTVFEHYATAREAIYWVNYTNARYEKINMKAEKV